MLNVTTGQEESFDVKTQLKVTFSTSIAGRIFIEGAMSVLHVVIQFTPVVMCVIQATEMAHCE